MKTKTSAPRAEPSSAKRISMVLALAGAVLFLPQKINAIPTVDLLTAGDFALLAGSEITDAGSSSSIVDGDVGLYPATGANIGLTESQVSGGTIYTAEQNGGLLNQAKNDLTTAYTDAGGRSVPGANNFGVVDNQLGGKTLFPGVYSFGGAATANLIGNLTLDANGDPDPVWIFQATSTLVTASGASVTMIDGTSCDVFWWVGSSATIGTNNDFVGNIMADQSIALQAGTTLSGSALARIAAVTLDHNTVTLLDCTTTSGGGSGGTVSVPDGGGTLLLLGFGLAALLGLHWKSRFGM